MGTQLKMSTKNVSVIFGKCLDFEMRNVYDENARTSTRVGQVVCRSSKMLVYWSSEPCTLHTEKECM